MGKFLSMKDQLTLEEKSALMQAMRKRDRFYDNDEEVLES